MPRLIRSLLPDCYVLDEQRRPRRPTSIEEYADSMTEEKCRVGPPRCFETMVFTTDHKPTGEQHRYSTWDDAAAGHAAVVRRMQREREKAQ